MLDMLENQHIAFGNDLAELQLERELRSRTRSTKNPGRSPMADRGSTKASN